MEAPNPRVFSAARSIVVRSVIELVDEIHRIDSRLVRLGDSEEEVLEEILLTILREHYEEELRRLLAWLEDTGSDEAEAREAAREEAVAAASPG